MAERQYRYVIVGGGLAAGKAVEGIREHDQDGSIVIICDERHLPYERPPLTKQLWFGKKQVEDLFTHPQDYYGRQAIDTILDAEVIALDADNNTAIDNRGHEYHYEKLLLATGGTPRRLTIPGADLDGIFYYRYLDDYLTLRPQATEGKSATVIGGGFIGSEIAAALTINKVAVTMIYPGAYMVPRVFPVSLGKAMEHMFVTRGVTIYHRDTPVAIEKLGEKFVTHTKDGRRVESDLLIVGVGITPNVRLAEIAGLTLNNGIVVNEWLQSSNSDIYAAGDNANFLYYGLDKRTRVEHWDNALNQGKYAGANMAGADQRYDYMPYFFSDLFEFGYEAVGEVSSELETYADWQRVFDTGVIYYLRDGRVRGAMMCNVWDQVETARKLIREGRQMTLEQLQGAIGKKGNGLQAA